MGVVVHAHRFKLIFCVLIALAIPAETFPDSAQNENESGLRDTVILVIRHAEDADDGSGLSPVGDARARAYASYFKNFTIDGRPLKLDHIFSTRNFRNSHRPRLTIEPTGQELGLTIDDRFKNKQFLESSRYQKPATWRQHLDLLASRQNSRTTSCAKGRPQITPPQWQVAGRRVQLAYSIAL